MTSEFQPDVTTLRLLHAEHVNGTWVGKELLPIANRIRNAGGTEADYRRWVTASGLWASYTGSTSDPATAQRKHIASAWDRAERSKPFELDDMLSDLLDRIAAAAWGGRAGNRNRAAALAFVAFCRDRNCYTRTVSSYELAKYMPGTSAKTAARALADLVGIGLLQRVERRDRRTSRRSTSRYAVNLYWKPTHGTASNGAYNPKGISDSMNTGKHSLRHMCQLGDTVYEVDLSDHDIWTHRTPKSGGLGQSAYRVWQQLPEHPGHAVFALADPASIRDRDDDSDHTGKSAADLAGETGLTRRAVDTALGRLFDNCLAVKLPGKPHRWLRAAYPPVDALAEFLGCAGALVGHVSRIEQRQTANRAAYPNAYNPEGMTA
ncbi:hypothetical protein ACXPWS_09150 [Mycobacterium sp. BMJ-28]